MKEIDKTYKRVSDNFLREWRLNSNIISDIKETIYYRENKIVLNMKLSDSEYGEMQFTRREIVKAE